MIAFSGDQVSDPSFWLSREWLETNGLGGYAMSTIAGLNSRRYHGLLVAALGSPVNRYVLLSKLEETLLIDGQPFELSTNHYSGATHPQGYRYLTEFRLDPGPVWTFNVDGRLIEKRLFMPDEENAVVTQYRTIDGSGYRTRRSSGACQLILRPLIAFRDYHSLTRENHDLDPEWRIEPHGTSLQPYASLPRLHFCFQRMGVTNVGQWYRQFDYHHERERGLEHQEDLFCPFELQTDLSSDQAAQLAVGLHPDAPFEIKRKSIADHYIVRRGTGHTVIAGYPWFGDWGRDTFIALPGLALVTGRHEIARSILTEYGKLFNQGLLPNRFIEGADQPEYNTVDATLWYFEALRAYLEYSDDRSVFGDGLLERLVESIDWHTKGTLHGIGMDEDGLLSAGAPGLQLTWMDAKVGDWVVTPRMGKPVEIQALWHNALLCLGEWTGDAKYAQIAQRAKVSFDALFWNGRYFDDVAGDRSLRPNQIFALSLAHSIARSDRALPVLETVEQELLTPFGLRTLSPNDPDYRPHCEGDRLSREGAYHQGTVWTWLAGHFWTAAIRHQGDEAKERASAWLQGLESHLNEACVGHVSEIFDAEPPHMPRGCPAQAWSIAEILRLKALLTLDKADGAH